MPLLKEESGKNNSAVALLLTDVINDLDFDQADDLPAQALPDGEEDRHPQTRSRTAANSHRLPQ